MDANELRRAIRGSGWLIVLVVIACGVAAIVFTARSEPRYESDSQLFVAATERDFSEQRALSYAGLATSPKVTTPVIEELRLPATPRELSRRIKASAPPDTVLINLTVSDRDPVRAQLTARAVGTQLVKLVGELERPDAAGKPSVRLTVSSPANLPSDPVAPNGRVNLAAGLVLGLLLGLLAAIARARVDRRIVRVDDLAPSLRAGVLAEIPFDRTAATTPAAGLRGIGAQRAEAVRRLRANLRFATPEDPPRSIVVTSSVPGEGGSTTALCLALAMADAGTDVVLVEADLRRPALAGLLGLSRNAGMAGYLAGTMAAVPLLQRSSAASGNGALRVLVAGAAGPHPSELLSSSRLPALLAELRGCCDVVLIDAPPLLPVTDAALLAGAADGVVLVLRMGFVTQPELDRSLEILSSARAGLLGLVANGVVQADRSAARGAYPAIPDPAAMRVPAAAEAAPAAVEAAPAAPGPQARRETVFRRPTPTARDPR